MAQTRAVTEQPSLFDLIPSHWQDEEQIDNARRVAGNIGADVMRFCAGRLRAGLPEFHMETLRADVGKGCAPDSAGRILRLLRQAGLVDYVVVNRAHSLYRLLGSAPTPSRVP